MQPFDALTLRAVLQEATPMLLNHRFEDVYQLSRDEIVITLRSRSEQISLLLSAHALYGRICIVKDIDVKAANLNKRKNERSQLTTLLRRDLLGATLVGIEQPVGERVVDLVFSCQNQVGVPSFNTVTAEIMGRHSNIIFWRRNDKAIITSSHVVTGRMSRYREVSPGLSYVRPPIQDKLNIYKLTKLDFDHHWQKAPRQWQENRTAMLLTLESWLLNTYSGFGKNLISEICEAALSLSSVESAKYEPAHLSDHIWQMINKLQTTSVFAPAIRDDFQQYRLINFAAAALNEKTWLTLPTVNELVNLYYSTIQKKAVFRSLQERLLNLLKSDLARLAGLLETQQHTIAAALRNEHDKVYGDALFANLDLAKSQLAAGADTVCLQDIFSDPSGVKSNSISVPLDRNLSAAANAQKYYHRYSRAKRQKEAAQQASDDLELKIAKVKENQQMVEHCQAIEELSLLKEELLPEYAAMAKKNLQASKSVNKSNLISATSGDGWTIYMGRNRIENDQLLRHVAQPNDIWLHALGQSGSHVLIKMSSGQQEPPRTTIIEAAQLAAHFSKAKSTTRAKVRVVYTHCRFVKKMAGGKPGAVTYENEKVIEVEIDGLPPKLMRQLA